MLTYQYSMSTRKYALVFSVITIVYLAIEALVQFIIGPEVLSLSSRGMFIVFGSILVVNAVLFIAVNFILLRSSQNSTSTPKTKDYSLLSPTSPSPSSSVTYYSSPSPSHSPPSSIN